MAKIHSVNKSKKHLLEVSRAIFATRKLLSTLEKLPIDDNGAIMRAAGAKH